MRDIALLVFMVAAGANAAHLHDNRQHDDGMHIPTDFPSGPIGQEWSYGLQFEVKLEFRRFV